MGRLPGTPVKAGVVYSNPAWLPASRSLLDGKSKLGPIYLSGRQHEHEKAEPPQLPDPDVPHALGTLLNSECLPRNWAHEK